MADQIVVIDKVEDDSYDGKDFKKVTDKAGQVWKIKQGRGGALKEKWGLLEEGKAIKLMMGDFQGKPFGLDFGVGKDGFVAEAAEKVQAKQVDTKDKGICLSYAKDLVIAGKVEFKNILPCAETFYRYTSGDLEVKDDKVFKEIIEKYFQTGV